MKTVKDILKPCGHAANATCPPGGAICGHEPPAPADRPFRLEGETWIEYENRTGRPYSYQIPVQGVGVFNGPLSDDRGRRLDGGHPEFLKQLDEMKDLHLLKSGGYGTGSDPFANFTAVAAVGGRARFEYPLDRIVEKVTRAKSLIQQGRISELGEEFADIAGLAMCAEAMRREDTRLAARDHAVTEIRGGGYARQEIKSGMAWVTPEPSKPATWGDVERIGQSRADAVGEGD